MARASCRHPHRSVPAGTVIPLPETSVRWHVIVIGFGLACHVEFGLAHFVIVSQTG